MRKIIKIFIAAMIFSTPAMAAWDNPVYMQYWGEPRMDVCQTQNIGEAAIGVTRASCTGATRTSTCRVGDDFGTIMMLAYDVHEGGAKLCPTSIIGEHHKRDDAWPTYRKPTGNNSEACFWLCRPGYGGAECRTNTTNTCNPKLFNQDTFADVKMDTERDRNDITHLIYFFIRGIQRGDCGHNEEDHHDLILGMSKFAPGGHGAFLRGFTIRGNRDDWKSYTGWVEIYPSGPEVLACMNGYQPNGDNTDCVAINSAVCEAAGNLCTGWAEADFNPSIHKLVQQESGCAQYRCIADGQGFVSATNRACTACVDNTSDYRSAVSILDGQCYKCTDGQVFNQKSGRCESAVIFTQIDLSYGPGQNANSTLVTQCWTKTNPMDYKNCVFGITRAN